MPQLQSIPTIIAIGKISAPLAMADADKQRFRRGNALGENLWIQITVVTWFIEQRYFTFPDDPTLFATCNYLYQLCGKYALQALNIIGNTGTVVQFTNNGTCVNVAWNKVQLIIGDPSAAIPTNSPTPNDGDTTALLPYAIMPKSENVTYQGIPVKLYPSMDFNYLATYSSASTNYAFKVGTDPAPLSAGYGLEFEFAQILSSGPCSAGGGIGTGLQAVRVLSTQTGDTLTVPQLGTFVSILIAGRVYDDEDITQIGQDLDCSKAGGVESGKEYLTTYYP